MGPQIEFGSKDEAIVFFDWLSRFNDSDSSESLDPVVQKVLWDLEAALEASLPEVLSDRYEQVVKEAQARVGDPKDGASSDG